MGIEGLRVADFMTRDVSEIKIWSDVRELEKMLLDQHVHGVPVVNEDDVLVGVVSQTDLLAWHHDTAGDGGGFYDPPNPFIETNGDSNELTIKEVPTAKVEEIMSPRVRCIRSDRPIAVAASAMITGRIHRLVVVDEQLHVLGIVSAFDLLKALPGVEKLIEEREGVKAADAP